MFVIRALRLNKFKPSPIVTPRRLFQLFGLSAPKVNSQQTAEAIDQTIPYGAKPTQLLQLGVQMAENASDFAEHPETAKPLDPVKPREL